MPRAFTLGFLAAALLAASPAVAAPCNGTYVKEKGQIVTVSPTGGDDTANLQCAIDRATALGPGSTVRLVAGTFKTAQLLFSALHGSFRGAGRDATLVRNLDTPVPIDNPVPWEAGPPGPDNRYPSLLSVTGGSVTLADFALRIVGYPATEDWYFFGGGPYNFFVPAVLLYGSHSTLVAERIEISADGCFPAADGNLLVAVEFWNYAVSPDPSTWPTSSTLRLRDSVFDTCPGLFAADLVDATIEVSRSRFQAAYGVMFSDVDGARLTVAHNDFVSPEPGTWLHEGNFGYGIIDTQIVVRNNRYSGAAGIVIEDNWQYPTHPYFSGVDCAIVGNNTEAVTDVGYFLGAGTSGCTVVGHAKDTLIDNSDGGHVIVGVTPGTGGVGHAISPLLRSGMPQ